MDPIYHREFICPSGALYVHFVIGVETTYRTGNTRERPSRTKPSFSHLATPMRPGTCVTRVVGSTPPDHEICGEKKIRKEKPGLVIIAVPQNGGGPRSKILGIRARGGPGTRGGEQKRADTRRREPVRLRSPLVASRLATTRLMKGGVMCGPGKIPRTSVEDKTLFTRGSYIFLCIKMFCVRTVRSIRVLLFKARSDHRGFCPRPTLVGSFRFYKVFSIF